MREIPCQPLESISASPRYDAIITMSAAYRKGSLISLLAALLFFAPISLLMLPLFIAWLSWVIFSLFSFFASVISLLSPTHGAGFDFVTFIVSNIISFVISLVGAVLFIVYFFFAVWMIDTFRAVILPKANVATKALILDNAEEASQATTSGLFGFFYRRFERSVNRIISLSGKTLESYVEELYPKGGVVLRAPVSNVPVICVSPYSKIFAGETGGKIVVVFSFNGAAQAIGVFDNDGGKEVLAKIRDMGESVQDIDSLR